MELINVQAAWIGIFCGFLSGALLGLKFHDEQWLGGYGSWQRRMLRLGHISFFGIAIINFFFAISIRVFDVLLTSSFPSYLLITGAVTMPLICFLSAYKKSFRHLFFIPVLCLLTGCLIFLTEGITP